MCKTSPNVAIYLVSIYAHQIKAFDWMIKEFRSVRGKPDEGNWSSAQLFELLTEHFIMALTEKQLFRSKSGLRMLPIDKTVVNPLELDEPVWTPDSQVDRNIRHAIRHPEKSSASKLLPNFNL